MFLFSRFRYVTSVFFFLPVVTSGYCTTAEMDTATSLNSITFGSGTSVYSSQTLSSLGFTTAYTQVYSGNPQDGQLALVTAVPSNNNAWLAGSLDHTTDASDQGYMMLVNGNNAGGQFSNITLSGYTVGTYCRITFYVANIVASGKNLDKPSLTFDVYSTGTGTPLVARAGTGPLAETSSLTWQKVDLSFLAQSTSVLLVMKSNAGTGIGGIDFVIDDIESRTCPPRAPTGD